MKILIMSDIHGNLVYVEKIMEVIKKENFDQIIILGDTLRSTMGSGWMSESDIFKVCDYLNSLKDKIIAVRGNCDTEYDQKNLQFNISELYKVIEIDNRKWYLTHGNLNEMLPKLEKNSILFNGHSHRAELSYFFINPGSLSLPRGDDTNSYIIYENNIFHLYDLNDNSLIETLDLNK